MTAMGKLESAFTVLAFLVMISGFVSLFLRLLGIDPAAADLALVIFLITGAFCGAVNFALSWFVTQ